jgi:uncharacterized LabA/DUF88 family protein
MVVKNKYGDFNLMNRAVVLIDGGYFRSILDTDFDRPKIDFLKFSDTICGGDERLRTYYYTCMPYQSSPPTDDEKRRFSAADKFVYTLRNLPRFDVRLGKLAHVGKEFVQKRVDILLAVDLVRMSWGRFIGTAILVTGDSDFVPAVEAAKDAGVLVRLYYSQSSIHDELRSAVDESFVITKELIDSCKRDAD